MKGNVSSENQKGHKRFQMNRGTNTLRLIRICLIGFSSGIPLFLTSKTLALWLNDFGVDYGTIGFLSIVTLPHALSFLWAPILDHIRIPFFTIRLGQRRSWLLLSQFILFGAIAALSMTNPLTSLSLMVFFALVVAIAAATQETLMLAYQMQSLPKSQYGPGEAIGVLGFRIGMLVSGAGALYLSDTFSWQAIYLLMSLTIFVGIFTVILSPEPIIQTIRECETQGQSRYNECLDRSFRKIIINPFRDFMKNPQWYWIVLLIFLFNMGDNLFGNFSNIFYVELDFSRDHIANATKVFGMLASILGGLCGGFWVYRLGFLRGMFLFGTIHGLSNLLYLVMLEVGNDIPLLYVTTTLEHFTAGMRTSALFSFQLTVCNVRYAASQLSFLTSIYSLSRTTFSFLSGFLLEFLGWHAFIILMVLSSIPGLLIVYILMGLQKHQSLAQPPN